MKTHLLILFPVALLLCSTWAVQAYEDANLEDDDFAEFEQFESDDDAAEPVINIKLDNKPQPAQEQIKNTQDNEEDILVEDEDSEFEHFQDPEEFEGFQETPQQTSEQPKITISKVPVIRPKWDAYWLEGILCLLLAAYAFSYAAGRAKNTSVALNFLKTHKPLLEDNFTLVGETGSDVVALEGSERGWKREAEHCFTLWCSGRLCCEGMLLTLKLIKRQDLFHVLLGVARPTPDTLLIRVELGKDDSDPFVLCVAQKKIAAKLSKEMQDLSVFCGERRPGDKHGLPTALSVLSETAEATSALLDAKVTAALTAYHKHVNYIHVSDQYCGPKQLDEPAVPKPPNPERVLLVSLSLSGDEKTEHTLLQLVFYLLDKIKRLRLSKEALSKCEKRRQKVAEAWQRGAHAARQEQAALRREEKRKMEKEKILAEDDPEKQRRWELKEQKRQMKKKTPKMKQLKVKAH